MKKNGFTLVEILAAIIILSILTSLSIVAYQKTLETNDERICQQQQKILQGAIEAYTIENDSLPNELAQLKPEHIHLAYLKITGQRPGNKLMAFWQDFLGTRPATAQTLPELGKYYNYDTRILFCPADKIRTGTTSYKINTYSFTDTSDIKDTDKTNYALIYDREDYHRKILSNGETYQVSTGPTGLHGKKTIIPNGAPRLEGASEHIDPPPTPSPNTTTPTEDVAEETEGDHLINNDNLTAANCCLTRENWKKLKKRAKRACKNAGFHPQKKNGTCVDRCFNNCPPTDTGAS